MKKIFLLLTISLLGLFANVSQATPLHMTMLSSAVSNTTISFNKEIIVKDGTPDVKKAPKKSTFYRLTHPIETLRDGDNKDIIFYLLCIFIGTLGLHRLIMGSKPIIILWYILATLAGILITSVLSLIGFPLLGFLGWIIVYALPLSDLISALMNGTSYFSGNDDIFAGFKGLSGGAKK